ncbi:MAG: isochorismatase family protein, partial [Planctomycetes bacterium]|nr:isochorismatase family protein [Planctomycetota bacterium]
RDRDGHVTERLPTRYRIEVGQSGDDWQVVATSDDRAAYDPQARLPDQARTAGLPSEVAQQIERIELEINRMNDELARLVPTKAYVGTFEQPEATHNLYRGEPLPRQLKLSADKPVIDYFQQFSGLDAGPRYNNAGFWDLPIPVTRDVDVDPEDVVIYDTPGYEPLKKFLQAHGIRHVLLTGYATDMCFCRTTAGYENLSKDFNVFLVGDATLATFPANSSPRFATNASISFASLEHLITQVSWIEYRKPSDR